MALTGLNRALTEFRGTVDGFTYRMTPEGKVCVYAHNPSEKPPTDAQLSRRGLFAYAQHYARHVLEDPLQRELYQQRAKQLGKPANTLLVSNYLTPPQVDRVELGGYQGGPGGEIAILASDAIAVARVTVEIRGVDGAVFESGAATETHGVWRYRTTAEVPAGTPWRVQVTVANRADHAALLTLPAPGIPAAGAPEFRTRLPRDAANTSPGFLIAMGEGHSGLARPGAKRTRK